MPKVNPDQEYYDIANREFFKKYKEGYEQGKFDQYMELTYNLTTQTIKHLETKPKEELIEIINKLQKENQTLKPVENF